jgi:uncharacterized membrane protein
MEFTPLVAIHTTAALLAAVTGPVALWARRGPHAQLHRAFGYAWVTLMVIAAASALFIRSGELPNIAGFGPIHLFIPLVLAGLFGAFWFLAKGDIRSHRRTMLGLYLGGCLGAGAFALLPNRLLGQVLLSLA